MAGDMEKLILENCEIPPMPNVAAKVVDMLAGEDVSAAQLTEVVSRDTALATRVLNMANSVFYRRLEEIRELQSAIVMLGMRTVRNLVLGASLKQLFRPASLFEAMLWEHSIAAAIAATMLAREAGYPQSGEVMVAGLLHDVGKNILNRSMPKRYQYVVERVYAEGAAYHEIEYEVFGFAHHHVGPLLVKYWNFPMDLGKAIYYHHEIGDIGTMDEEQQRLIALVHLADLFCRKLGLGYREPDETIDIVASPAVTVLSLDLDAENLTEYQERIVQSFSEERGRFA
jgi:putative nucleotidyltransferase with HDIG domain